MQKECISWAEHHFFAELEPLYPGGFGGCVPLLLFLPRLKSLVPFLEIIENSEQ